MPYYCGMVAEDGDIKEQVANGASKTMGVVKFSLKFMGLTVSFFFNGYMHLTVSIFFTNMSRRINFSRLRKLQSTDLFVSYI